MPYIECQKTAESMPYDECHKVFAFRKAFQ